MCGSQKKKIGSDQGGNNGNLIRTCVSGMVLMIRNQQKVMQTRIFEVLIFPIRTQFTLRMSLIIRYQLT